MQRRLLFLLLGALTTSAALAACGEEDQITPMSIDIHGPNDDPDQQIFAFPDPDWQDIRRVRVSLVQGSDLVERQTFDYDDFSGKLPTIPWGENFLLTVEGLDAVDTVIASGASQRFDVIEGEDPPAVQVFTARSNTFTPAFRYVNNEQVPGSEERFTGSVVAPFELPDARGGAAWLELPDGRIMVIGGARLAVAGGSVTFGDFFSTVEIYTPRTGNWLTVTIPGCDISALGVQACALKLSRPRAFHAAALLPDGRIVVTGGIAPEPEIADTWLTVSEVDVIELTDAFEATIDTVTPISGAVSGRAFHSATATADGSILVAGGIRGVYGSPEYIDRVDVITPMDGQLPIYEQALDADGNPLLLNNARAVHEAVNIDDGDHGVILIGGRNETAVVATSEVIYRDGNGWGIERFVDRDGSIDLTTGRFGHRAVRYACPDDDGIYVAIVGGYTGVTGPRPLDGGAPTGSLEVYEAPTSLSTPFVINQSPAGNFANGRAFAQVAAFDTTGDLVVSGGIGANGDVLASAERAQLNWQTCLPYTSGGDLDLAAAGSMSTPRAFGHATSLESFFGMFFGGTSGTDAVRQPEFFNPNDYWVF